MNREGVILRFSGFVEQFMWELLVNTKMYLPNCDSISQKGTSNEIIKIHKIEPPDAIKPVENSLIFRLNIF